MSMMIRCPYCGWRPINEFIFGEVPVVPDDITDPDERDVDFAFMRNNPEGPVTERWFHAYGCRRWLTVRRDTRNDTLLVMKWDSASATDD